MKDLTGLVDIATEVKAVAALVSVKWTPIEGLEGLVLEVAQKAMESGKAWFEQHALWEVTNELNDARMTRIYGEGAKERLDKYYDAGYNLFNQMGYGASSVRDAVVRWPEWDFSDASDKVFKALASKYPDLSNAKPHGWAALAKGYEDFDGQEEYHPTADRDLFQGHDTASAGACDFPGRIALPYVMYDEKCQGRKAKTVLVSAIFGHFLSIAEHNNTQVMLADLRETFSRLPDEHIYEVTVEFKHPMLRVIGSLADTPATKEQHEQSKAAQAAFQAMSEAEKEEVRRKNQENLMEDINSLRDSAEFEKQQTKKRERILELIRREFA